MRALGVVALVLVLTGLAAGLLYAPSDAVQGNVQRIMYLHVPSILTAYLAFGVVFVASVGYLWRRSLVWDEVARASAELGVVFTGVTLLSGSIWGKPTWGTWWVWDARLTSTAVLFVIYVAYLLLRVYVDDRERAATYAAVVGIIGALDIPLIHFSVQWWRTLHQPATILRPERGPIAEPMLVVLLLNLGAFAVLYAFLMGRRLALMRLDGRPSEG